MPLGIGHVTMLAGFIRVAPPTSLPRPDICQLPVAATYEYHEAERLLGVTASRRP